VHSGVQNQLVKLGYNNMISAITSKTLKSILKFNVLKYIFLKMGLEYKVVVILIIIIV
jgi:hypothetical protein